MTPPPASIHSDTSGRALTDRLGLRPDALPGAGNWFPEENVLEFLLDQFEARPGANAVVCGAGLSVAVLARAAAQAGQGRVWALESDERTIAMTEALLNAVGAEACILRAELVEYDKHNLWYAPWTVAGLPECIDLLFLDGPGHFAGRMPRWPAGPELFGRLSDGAAVLLDDAKRVKEKKALKRWAEAYPWLVQHNTRRSGAVLLCREGVETLCTS